MDLEKKAGKPRKPQNEILVPKKEGQETLVSVSAKPKRIMTDAQKTALSLGRVKAHERMRSLKADKQELIELKKQTSKPLKSVDSDEEGDEAVVLPPVSKSISKPKAKKVVVVASSSDEEDEGVSSPSDDTKTGKRVSRKVIEKHYYHAPPPVKSEALPTPPQVKSEVILPPPPPVKLKTKLLFK